MFTGMKNRVTLAPDVFFDIIQNYINSNDGSALERALLITFFSKFIKRIAVKNTAENTMMVSVEKLTTAQSSPFVYNSVSKDDSLFNTAIDGTGCLGYRLKVTEDGNLVENHVLNVSTAMGTALFKGVTTDPMLFELELPFNWDFIVDDADKASSVTDNDPSGSGGVTEPKSVPTETQNASPTTAKVVKVATPSK